MIITASSIILQNKKILLAKRVEHTSLYPGCWTFPGGKGEEGESPEQTAIRETKEEVNIDFVPTELFVKNHYEDRKMFRFLGNWSGNIQLQEEELMSWNWFNFHQSAELEFAFDYKGVVELLYHKGLID